LFHSLYIITPYCLLLFDYFVALNNRYGNRYSSTTIGEKYDIKGMDN